MNQSPPAKYLSDQYIKQLNESVMKPDQSLNTRRIVSESFK
jgi:hypothetical protein